MNCREFDLWLQEYLDGRSLSLHGDLADHLGHCSTCRELFQAGQLLQQGMEDLPRLTPLPSSLQRIVAEVVSDHRSRRRKRLRLVGAVAAAIALVALPRA
ncbi:MAG: anti-sigma factor, partial [Bdellovibrionales bacterium]